MTPPTILLPIPYWDAFHATVEAAKAFGEVTHKDIAFGVIRIGRDTGYPNTYTPGDIEIRLFTDKGRTAAVVTGAAPESAEYKEFSKALSPFTSPRAI